MIFSIKIIHKVLANNSLQFQRLQSTMMQFTEETHYRRRETQPSPAPHRSKEAVGCMLCSDPGDDDNSQIGVVHMKRECLDECFDVVVIDGESVYEVGDYGWLIWEVGDSGR